MSSVRNILAYSIGEVAFQFATKLGDYVKSLEPSGDEKSISSQQPPHSLLQNFQTNDFPKFTNIIGLIERVDLSKEKLERIDRFLDYFKSTLETLDFEDETTWNFFDSAFSILMLDVKKVLMKPILQLEAIQYYSRPGLTEWTYSHTPAESYEKGSKPTPSFHSV